MRKGWSEGAYIVNIRHDQHPRLLLILHLIEMDHSVISHNGHPRGFVFGSISK